MKIELSILTNWRNLKREIDEYCFVKCYIERGFGKIPDRLNNDEYYTITSGENDLIDTALGQHVSSPTLEYIETIEEEEDSDEIIFWAVIYPVLEDE